MLLQRAEKREITGYEVEPLRTMFEALQSKFLQKKLPSVRLCAVTAPSDFPLFSAPKKHLRDSRFQDAAKVHEAVSQQFRSQSPEFCAEGIHSLTQRCDKSMNLLGDYG
jgi:hypothetical protein